MKKLLTLFILIPLSVMDAQDYYASAYKLSGTELKSALHNIIKGHTSVSYTTLWTSFQTTDKKPNGKVWDMYSDIPEGTPPYEYTFISDQCGNYSGEGSCYNREHSWPKSWFSDLAPAYTDLFHLFPTDGKVNGMRNNYNYGNVGTASWTSQNGSKLGTSSTPGYSGIVFEPIDAYKGDLARGHFYMSVRYYTEDAGWSASDGTNKSELLPWYADLLYSWHLLDSVSEKEISRNSAVYAIQHNRNPFIDHPEFAAEIWETSMAPSVVSVISATGRSVVVDFSRYVDSTVAVSPANFTIDNGIGHPISLQWGVNNDVSKISMVVPKLSSGIDYTLTIDNLKSINNVAMKDTSVSFTSTGITTVSEDFNPISAFALHQNFPNPFNPSTKITYQLGSAGFVSLKVYTMIGKEISMLVNGIQSAGEHTVEFDASSLPSGMYFYSLRSGNCSSTKRMVILK
ncbi:MAG: endonuclease [Bacteroidota bacterium]|jgi:endonuclease I